MPQLEGESPIQRGHYFALVDEADSVFIDEARTPLILGNPNRPALPSEQVVYLWADRVVRELVPVQHFRPDAKKGALALTATGKHKVRWASPPCGPHGHAMDKLFEHVERALEAHHRYRRDQQYLVQDGKVVIIDEYSGRSQPDRHWQDGLHARPPSRRTGIAAATSHGGGRSVTSCVPSNVWRDGTPASVWI
jgi:preprotein translocase subunit SecA